MLKKINIVIILLTLISFSLCKFDFLKGKHDPAHHFAVLVAGSNGFWNYRHQSDIFHSYHILIDNGVPKENIIVLAYDDIANDPQNPIPGKIFNKPDPNGPGVDVYAGVQIDYKANDVNPDNFLAVIQGAKDKVKGGNGRVLNTTENDRIFIYFSDHGATGLVAFPNGELYADQLMKVLIDMSKNKKYKELVFYLEACESGSMFDKILPDGIKIYTTTAANPNQSSWATYCSPDENINGVHIGSCLGDEYSVNWMEDSDKNKGLTETLENQFENVKQKTKNSEVHQYGDLTFTSEAIGDFQGDDDNLSLMTRIKRTMRKGIRKIKSLLNLKKKESGKKSEYKKYLDEAKKSAIDSRDAKLKYFYDRAEKMNDLTSHEAYLKELKHMKNVDGVFEKFNEYFGIEKLSAEVKQINFECLRNSVESYKTTCTWGEYDLKYVRSIAHACVNKTSEEISQVFKIICEYLQ